MKKIVSGFLMSGLVFISILIVGRIYLEQTLLNENHHYAIQEEANYYKRINDKFEGMMRHILSRYDLRNQLSKDIISIELIEEVVQSQTRELIEIYRGDSETFTEIKTRPILTAFTYLLVKEGYDVADLQAETTLFEEVSELVTDVVCLYNHKEYKQLAEYDYYIYIMRLVTNDYLLWICCAAFISISISLVYIWRKNLLDSLFYFVVAIPIIGAIMFMVFGYLDRVVLIKNRVTVGEVRTKMFVMALQSFYAKMHEFGGYALMNGIIIFGVLIVYKELRQGKV